MTRSKKLTHQINRYLGSVTAESELVELLAVLKQVESPLITPTAIKTIENFPSFLNTVDASYEKYEDNLAVAERNISVSSHELVEANRAIASMVNSLGQGFLMFDKEGICTSVYSKACETLLETIPAGKHITAVLKLDAEQTKKMESLLRLAFSKTHAMSFDEIMRFAPKAYAHAAGIHVHLAYKADLARDNATDRIVLVATDISEQIHAQEIAKEKKAAFEMIERISHDRAAFCEYIRRACDAIHKLDEQGSAISPVILLREIHTLKGGAGMFRLQALARIFHDLETALQTLVANRAAPDESLNGQDCRFLLDFQKALQQEIDALAQNLNQLLGIDIRHPGEEARFNKKSLYDFADYLESQGLRDAHKTYIEKICAVPLTTHLRRFDLVLSDLAARLNKKILPIVFTGETIPIVTEPYRSLFDSFTHLFRNIADHGIEAPEDRVEAGKPESGTVTIHTALLEKQAGKWLRLEISDDGTGINFERAREKLKALKPDGLWNTLGETDILASLIQYNVSTKDSISLYSGRGIGLGAVNAEVVKIGGTMTLSSIPGKETRYTIEIPYWLKLRA